MTLTDKMGTITARRRRQRNCTRPGTEGSSGHGVFLRHCLKPSPKGNSGCLTNPKGTPVFSSGRDCPFQFLGTSNSVRPHVVGVLSVETSRGTGRALRLKPSLEKDGTWCLQRAGVWGCREWGQFVSLVQRSGETLVQGKIWTRPGVLPLEGWSETSLET